MFPEYIKRQQPDCTTYEPLCPSGYMYLPHTPGGFICRGGYHQVESIGIPWTEQERSFERFRLQDIARDTQQKSYGVSKKDQLDEARRAEMRCSNEELWEKLCEQYAATIDRMARDKILNLDEEISTDVKEYGLSGSRPHKKRLKERIADEVEIKAKQEREEIAKREAEEAAIEKARLEAGRAEAKAQIAKHEAT